MSTSTERVGVEFEEALVALVDAGDRADAETCRIVADSVADTIAVAVAGAASADAAAVRRAVGLHGALGRAQPADGALLDAFAAHALDFDDVDETSMAHLSAVIVPALLAAERSADADRFDYAEGYAAGYRAAAGLAAALGVRSHYGRGWHSSATIGAPAAAVAIARASRLEVSVARNAIGIAASLAAGSRQNFGSSTKPLHVAMASSTAVRAVELARCGIDAHDRALSGPLGYVALHGGDGDLAAASALLRRNGMLRMQPPSMKLHACCFGLQRIADAAVRLGPLREDVVRRVHVVVPAGTMVPLSVEWPTSAREAQFSVPYIVALALTKGAVALDDLPVTDDDVSPRPAGFSVSVQERETVDDDDLTIVELVTDRGSESVSLAVASARGAVSVSERTLLAKIDGCLRHAGVDADSAELMAASASLATAATSRPLRGWIARSRSPLAAGAEHEDTQIGEGTRR